MNQQQMHDPSNGKDKRTIELLDELLADYSDPKQIVGENGLLKQLTKKLVERAMEKEMTHHLGYEKHSPKGKNTGNSRNGHSRKNIKGDFGEVDITTPRDREGNFEPQIISKNQTHFSGFDDKIISMYSRGMTTREIQQHLKDIYGIEVSPDLISRVTDGVIEAVTEWQNRPLDQIYPIIYLDALRLKIRDEGHVKNKAVYLVIGINMSGKKEVLGLWIQQTEGAKFWMRVITDLKNRGVEDIFIACVDGLKGFPEAINTVYPDTEVQLCIVHMVRHSLKYVSYKDRKEVAACLKSVYCSANEKQAEQEMEKLKKAWDKKYPTISRIWENNWQNIIPFFAYPIDIRRAIYTTNAIESINFSLRKITKTRAAFPNDEAALKLLYLGLDRISKRWTMPIKKWNEAINQFAIVFEDRVPLYEDLN